MNEQGSRQSWPARLMVRMIRWYQRHLSVYLGAQCKYLPTCSNYALEAIIRYGAIKGGFMALWRIIRCNPFSHGGYDPVP